MCVYCWIMIPSLKKELRVPLPCITKISSLLLNFQIPVFLHWWQSIMILEVEDFLILGQNNLSSMITWERKPLIFKYVVLELYFHAFIILLYFSRRGNQILQLNHGGKHWNPNSQSIQPIITNMVFVLFLVKVEMIVYHL